jgi:hypothetical protein
MSDRVNADLTATFVSITHWLTGVRGYVPRRLPNNQPDVDRLLGLFATYPAVTEQPISDEHIRPIELLLSEVDALADSLAAVVLPEVEVEMVDDGCVAGGQVEGGVMVDEALKETCVVEIPLLAKDEVVESGVVALPEVVDDARAGTTLFAFAPHPRGLAAIILEDERNQLFAKLHPSRRIEPSLEWKNLPRRTLKKRAPPRLPVPSKRRQEILPEEIDGYVLTFPRRQVKQQLGPSVLCENYQRAKRVAKREADSRKLQEAAAKRAEEQRRRQAAADKLAEFQRRREELAANRATREIKRLEQQRTLEEVRARRRQVIANLQSRRVG